MQMVGKRWEEKCKLIKPLRVPTGAVQGGLAPPSHLWSPLLNITTTKTNQQNIQNLPR